MRHALRALKTEGVMDMQMQFLSAELEAGGAAVYPDAYGGLLYLN
jgi:hypothetical protein